MSSTKLAHIFLSVGEQAICHEPPDIQTHTYNSEGQQCSPNLPSPVALGFAQEGEEKGVDNKTAMGQLDCNTRLDLTVNLNCAYLAAVATLPPPGKLQQC